MNWFTHTIDRIGGGAEHLISSSEHALGGLADKGAHVLGDGLNNLGLGGAARWVDHAGDQMADHLGTGVPEAELGQTSDPAELIHGDVAAIRGSSAQLRTFSGAFGETSAGLAGMDSSHWTGQAADAFRSRYAPQPQRWGNAQSACGMAADSLESYGSTVEWAQGQARQAISLYEKGNQATAAAQSAYNQQVSQYNQAADAYNANLAAGRDPGVRPVQPGPFSDPGESLREQARGVLARARQERDQAAVGAAEKIRAATDMAPPEPSFTHRMLDDLGDAAKGGTLAGAHFDAGIIKGAGDIVKFTRSQNPLDPYNLTHLPEFVAGESSTGAGLLHDAMHPLDLVKSVLGSGWSSDPAEAFGRLVPNVALAVGTDGTGTAADAGADIGERAALSAADDSGTALRDAAANPDNWSRAPDNMTKVADPVDVASGDVVMDAADVELPGLLPLVVERAHRSSYRAGRWFGPSWASTLDQRLDVNDEGVVFAAANTVVLSYPHPGGDGEPVLPSAGPRWPLARDADGYTVTDPQAGQVWRFAPCAGHPVLASGAGVLPLASISDRNGHEITFSYDGTGAPAAISHSGGYRIRVTTAHGRVVGLSLSGGGPGGRDVDLVAYGYDERGNLAAVLNSSGRPLRLFYDGQRRLTGWADRNGAGYRFTYDAGGRCVRGDGTAGTLSAIFRYDPAGRATICTDSAGAVTTYRLNRRLQVTAQTDPLGNTTRQEWDEYGRLSALTDPLGRITRFRHDDSGNTAAIVWPDGTQATAAYNEHSLATRLEDPDHAVWRQAYDARGNLTSIAGPDGAVTRFSYDGSGHLAAVTEPLGNTTWVECDQAGLPVAVTEPSGAVTRYTRDAFGRVTEITDPSGGITRLVWAVEGKLISRVLPDGGTEQFAYDGEGNLIVHIDAAGRLTRAEYGPFDRVTAQTRPDGTRIEFGYDTELRPATVTLPGGLTWRYDHDPAGRLTSETDVNGATTRYRYDRAGQIAERVNAAGQAVAYAYDLLGNLVEAAADGAVTRYGYDPAGRLAHAAGPGAEIRLERDTAGRVVAETCNGRAVTSVYDAAGQRIRRSAPSGAETRWDYDPVGRPAAMHTADQVIRFGYDHGGREVVRELPGGARLTQRWDPAHRLASQTLTGDTAGTGRLLQHRAYRYRRDGCLAGVDDMLAGPRRFTLDAAARVTGVSGPDWAERYSYDPAGNIATAAWPIPPDRFREAVLRQDLQGPRTHSGTLITGCGATRYRHDPCGRVIFRQRTRISRKPETWHYTWDADDRLTAVTTPGGTRWRYLYDPLGRRIAKQRLGADGAVLEQTDFTWDGATLAEQTTSGYPRPGADTIGDVPGLDAPATGGNSSGGNGTGEPTAGASGGHGPERVITWDYEPGTFTPLTQTERTRLRDASQDEIEERFHAVVTDLIGTPSELIAPDGTLAGYQQHTLWGATIWNPDGATTPLRFPGQYHDPETALHYNNQRYYDPATGRYLTPDPLGLAPAPNPHTYVPNPTTQTDPLGLMTCARPEFTIAPRVLDQLNDPRLGPLQGNLTPPALKRLANSPAAQYVLDTRTGNINVIQKVGDVLLRITTPRDAFRIISVGPIRQNQVANLLKRGDFILIGFGG